MRLVSALAATTILGLGVAGSAWAQTTPAPATNPPERLQGTTTQQNPATATTPPPGTTPPAAPTSPATTGSPPTVSAPGSGTPSNNAVNTSPENNSGAPVPGANSFTESEARARIEGKGFSQVTGLKLDDKGIWRGSASKDGKSASVALDYQGNVVAE